MNTKKHTILIIDDSPTTLRSIGEMLSSNPQYNLLFGSSAREAMRLSGNHDVDLILMDYQMPEMDGFKTASIFSKNERTSDIPIIIMTAFDPSKDKMSTGLAHGAIDYILKPFTKREIETYLGLYLRFIEREREINKKLSEKNSELDNLNKEKNRFFSILSHDLISPFSGTNSMIEMLDEDFNTFDETELKVAITTLRKSSNKTFALLKNILDWVKSQINRFEYEPEEIDLSMIISDLLELFEYTLEEKEIVVANLFPDKLLAFSDENIIRTIIRNLISNAIKFSHPQSVITITYEKEDSKILLKVIDQGIGISEDRINNIFNIAHLSSKPGTNNETGNGMGLLLCKEFAKMQKGDLSIESKIKKGTTAILEIPISI
jgi:two-component system, sensor histidine kinase and response regulator